jgi:hypothetical protein
MTRRVRRQVWDGVNGCTDESADGKAAGNPVSRVQSERLSLLAQRLEGLKEDRRQGVFRLLVRDHLYQGDGFVSSRRLNSRKSRWL